jgi:predicted DNA-binding protein (MmcQ/YjbR family)
MNIEELLNYCLSMKGVTEDIKWGNNLVFSVGGKLFCLADLELPLRVTFKVEKEDFVSLTDSTDIIQAPYFAKMMWVCVLNEDRFSLDEWQHYLCNSYELVKMKLPKNIRESLNSLVG